MGFQNSCRRHRLCGVGMVDAGKLLRPPHDCFDSDPVVDFLAARFFETSAGKGRMVRNSPTMDS